MSYLQFWYFNVNYLSAGSMTSRSVRLSFLDCQAFWGLHIHSGYISLSETQ